jgi:hypothetical protein
MDMHWFAIRCVYHFDCKSDGLNIFEERIVCFKAATTEEAHEKASKESDEYAKSNDLVAHPQQEGYEQDGDDLIDGYKLWSELFESKESLEEFYENRYGKYSYHPE